jgi:DNA-binding transcriptional LysR family regulator
LVIQAVIAGIGVAVLPRFLLEDELASGRLLVEAERARSKTPASSGD